MDRSVNSPKDLLAHSERLEPVVPSKTTGLEALTQIKELEKIAQESLAQELIAKAAQAEPPADPQAEKVEYTTDNPQYSAALKDHAIIQALLSLKNKAISPKP